MRAALDLRWWMIWLLKARRALLRCWHKVPVHALVAVSLTLIVIGLLGLAEGGAESPRCNLSLFEVGCLMNSHGEFAGGIIGAAGGIFAGWLAYEAAQRKSAEDAIQRQQQQAAEQRDRERKQEEAREVALLAITQPIHAAAATLKAVRKAITVQFAIGFADADKEVSTGIAYIDTALRDSMIRDVIGDLEINQRLLIVAMISTLQTLVSISNKPRLLTDRNVRLQEDFNILLRIRKFLHAFDPELSAVFDKDSGTSPGTPRR